MRLPEAARLLHVTEATLTRWVRQGLLPSDTASGVPMDAGELARWARERGLSVGKAVSRPPLRAERLFASAVARGAVLSDIPADSASAAVRVAVDAAPGLDATQRSDVLERVLARERLASTALGRGVAIPHPRQPLVGVLDDPVIVIVHLRKPLDWAALDGELVRVVMLLLSPSAPVHLQLLSRVALVLKSDGVAAWLREGPPAQALVARMREIEESFDS